MKMTSSHPTNLNACVLINMLLIKIKGYPNSNAATSVPKAKTNTGKFQFDNMKHLIADASNQ